VSIHAEHPPQFEWRAPTRLAAFVGSSLTAAVVGLVLLILGLVHDARRAWFSYLTAWTFGATVCMGALLLLMVGHVSKASWMIVTRRLTEAVVDALPLYLLLFIPFAFGLSHVYPWAAPSGAFEPALRRAIEHKHGYLNPPLFVARTVAYFVEFIVVGGLLRAWSKENDEKPRIQTTRRMRRLSGGAMPLVALTLTWASFDWTMSLEPEWYSTIYGLYYFAGSFVAAIALVCVMLHLSRLRAAPRMRVTAEHAQAMGRVLFAMVIFWAYMAFSQLLIYWIADIPREVAFYARRVEGSWSAIVYLLVFGHFIIPFFLLLNRRLKRDTAYLAAIGAWMFIMHFVDVYWLIMPVQSSVGVRPHWLDLAAILFVGGLSCAWILHRYFTAAPIPLHDPNLKKGFEYEAAI
jgi:hypothetical protein